MIVSLETEKTQTEIEAPARRNAADRSAGRAGRHPGRYRAGGDRVKIADRIHLVGSGIMGFDLTDAYDCHVFLIDGGDELAIIDTGAGMGAERILANVQADGFDPGARPPDRAHARSRRPRGRSREAARPARQPGRARLVRLRRLGPDGQRGEGQPRRREESGVLSRRLRARAVPGRRRARRRRLDPRRRPRR